MKTTASFLFVTLCLFSSASHAESKFDKYYQQHCKQKVQNKTASFSRVKSLIDAIAKHDKQPKSHYPLSLKVMEIAYNNFDCTNIDKLGSNILNDSFIQTQYPNYHEFVKKLY